MASMQKESEQKTSEIYNREDEYVSAQRAAVEAVMIGRETLETAERQGEQLRNAETSANETEYKLDRATRLLRGMTWSGWLANKFSRDVEPPEYQVDGSDDAREACGPPRVYENVPEWCSTTTQAVQNYNANLEVLENCETDEQRDTCKLICDNMYSVAHKQVTELMQHQKAQAEGNFASKLHRDLKTLRIRQLKFQQAYTEHTPSSGISSKKVALFEGKADDSSEKVSNSPSDVVEVQQEEHLNKMALHLDELGLLATNLNESLSRHSNILESLDEKSESMLFKSKMVTRRADRLTQQKSWAKARPEFLYNASIRHIPSGKYLAVSSNDTLVLSQKFNETCIFGLWQRKKGGHTFGLQNQYSRKWMGQNLLGNLACSATSFDRREEWDVDEDWLKTTLLCASAGWGNGGYLLVRAEDGTINIGGGGLQDKKNAALWSIGEYEQNNSRRKE